MVLLIERSGCGCTLKTGTIIIGVLQALAGFSMMVSEALAAMRDSPRHLPTPAPPAAVTPAPTFSPSPPHLHPHDDTAKPPDLHTYVEALWMRSQINDEQSESRDCCVSGQRGLCAILAIAGALQLILSILLLYGADYENPRLVKPWVVFSMVVTSVIIAVYFGLAILTFALGHRTVGTAIMMGLIVTTGVSTYFITVVYSFYRQLVDRSRVPCII